MHYLDAIDELQVAQVSDSNEGLKMGKDKKEFRGRPLRTWCFVFSFAVPAS